jgi:hypothetical protein
MAYMNTEAHKYRNGAAEFLLNVDETTLRCSNENAMALQKKKSPSKLKGCYTLRTLNFSAISIPSSVVTTRW